MNDKLKKTLDWSSDVRFEKSDEPVGTVHTWADGKKHQKQSDGSWKEISDGAKEGKKEEPKNKKTSNAKITVTANGIAVRLSGTPTGGNNTYIDEDGNEGEFNDAKFFDNKAEAKEALEKYQSKQSNDSKSEAKKETGNQIADKLQSKVRQLSKWSSKDDMHSIIKIGSIKVTKAEASRLAYMFDQWNSDTRKKIGNQLKNGKLTIESLLITTPGGALKAGQFPKFGDVVDIHGENFKKLKADNVFGHIWVKTNEE